MSITMLGTVSTSTLIAIPPTASGSAAHERDQGRAHVRRVRELEKARRTEAHEQHR
jgi:hypothetical protein